MSISETSSIEAIRITNFKSIRNPVEITISPITILSGANSSGKSSVMQSILLLKQTLDVLYDPGILLLNGPNAKFSSYDQIINMDSIKEGNYSFSIGLDIQSNTYFQDRKSKTVDISSKDGFDLLFHKNTETNLLTIKQFKYHTGDNAYTLSQEQTSQELAENVPKSTLAAVDGIKKIGRELSSELSKAIRERINQIKEGFEDIPEINELKKKLLDSVQSLEISDEEFNKLLQLDISDHDSLDLAIVDDEFKELLQILDLSNLELKELILANIEKMKKEDKEFSKNKIKEILIDEIKDRLTSFVKEKVFIEAKDKITNEWNLNLGILEDTVLDLLAKKEKKLVLRNDRCFPYISIEDSDPIGSYDPNKIPLPTKKFKQTIQDIIHIPGYRGNPERSYLATNIGDSYPGTFEVYVASILKRWSEDPDNSKIKFVKEHLKSLGLAWDITPESLDDTKVSIKVGRIPFSEKSDPSDVVNITDVGIGVSQALPIVVALHAARPGQLVYIEQPELHLHPKAQHLLGKLFAKATKRGIKLVLETHSQLIIRSIQTSVANKEIDQEEVNLYWFSKNKETGNTEITPGKLNKDGAYGDWPSDFDDIILKSEMEYLDAEPEEKH